MTAAIKAFMAINSWMNRHEILVGLVIGLFVSGLCLANALTIVEGRTWQVLLAFMSGLTAGATVLVAHNTFISRRVRKKVDDLATLAGSAGYLKGMLEMHETMSGGERK